MSDPIVLVENVPSDWYWPSGRVAITPSLSHHGRWCAYRDDYHGTPVMDMHNIMLFFATPEVAADAIGARLP